jgi:hypothetical protein
MSQTSSEMLAFEININFHRTSNVTDENFSGCISSVSFPLAGSNHNLKSVATQRRIDSIEGVVT